MADDLQSIKRGTSGAVIGRKLKAQSLNTVFRYGQVEHSEQFCDIDSDTEEILEPHISNIEKYKDRIT